MILFLDNTKPEMMKFIVENNLLQKDYMQCPVCNYVEDNLKMMEANRPCPNCNEAGVKMLFPAEPQLQLIYADIVQSFFEYDQKYRQNRNLVIDWIQRNANVDKKLANELLQQSSELNISQFAKKYMKKLQMDEIEAMILFHSIIREKNIPKIQMSHIIVHSMTLLEMYLSYLIGLILMKTKTSRTVIIHIIDSNKNWNDYFKAIKSLSPIRWKEHIASKLFEGLSINFENLKKIRNDLVHQSCFVYNYQVVKDSVTMTSRLLPVIAELNNGFLLGDAKDV